MEERRERRERRKEEKTIEKNRRRGGQFAEFAEITFDWVLIPSMWEFQTLYYIMSVPLLPSRRGFYIFECRISFFVGSSHFLLVFVQQLVVNLEF